MIIGKINKFKIGERRLKKIVNGYSKIDYIQKRTIDYIMVIVLFSIFWPVILYTIYRIKKESPGPILFKQIRVGLNNKKFSCYKFRSMHTNSHFNPYTQDNDSRIFPFGHIMRKMRIDELAQLINVIKGDMHIVGPRAEWDILVNKYEKIVPNYHSRHNIRPGITGLAQIRYPYGRNAYDARRKLGYDLLYIKKWSIFLEMKVLFGTVSVILKRGGV
jgi:lipopolysaccharide/colanic/teichoic acid biosynthesis glycosyltransferase